MSTQRTSLHHGIGGTREHTARLTFFMEEYREDMGSFPSRLAALEAANDFASAHADNIPETWSTSREGTRPWVVALTVFDAAGEYLVAYFWEVSTD